MYGEKNLVDDIYSDLTHHLCCKFAFLLLHVGTFKRGSQFPKIQPKGLPVIGCLCQKAVSLQSLGGSPAKFSEKKKKTLCVKQMLRRGWYMCRFCEMNSRIQHTDAIKHSKTPHHNPYKCRLRYTKHTKKQPASKKPSTQESQTAQTQPSHPRCCPSVIPSYIPTLVLQPLIPMAPYPWKSFLEIRDEFGPEL